MSSAPNASPVAAQPSPSGGARISIALCTFNGARHLEAQLDSISAQTHPPYEVVACDDGSTDSTIAILGDFARRAPFQVEVEQNARNLGSTRNFERAIRRCTGDLIATCDQDDVWMPNKLALTLAAFEDHPGRGLVFTDALVVDEDLRPEGHRLWEAVHFGERQRRLVRRDRAFDLLLRQWAVTGATMTFRAAYRPLVLPIPEIWVHDAWIAFLVAAIAPIGLVEEPTVRYRQHASQQIGAPGVTRREMLRQARATGPAQFRRELERFRFARDRLSESIDPVRARDVLPRVEAKVAHQALRLAVSESRSRQTRILLALGELLRGGYSRYSPRTTHVIKDMFL